MTPDDLAERIDKDLKSSRRKHDEWRDEALTNYDYVAGRQLSSEEVSALLDMEREAITFNRIEPIVSSICGHQANNPQEVKFFPRTLGDAQLNEMLSNAAAWADDQCDATDELNDVFFDLVVTGMGWSDCYMDYTENMDGQLKTADRIYPLEMDWDWRARKRNIDDAKWVARSRWWDREEAKATWPKIAELDELIYAGEAFASNVESSPHVQAEDYPDMDEDAPDNSSWYNNAEDQVFITQYQWWQYETVFRVIDPMSGRLVELSENKFTKLSERGAIDAKRYIRQRKRVYYQAFKCGPIVLQQGICPYEKGFTLRCVTGKRDARKGTWFGAVRGMRDPQRWSNKLFMDIHELVVSNRRGGAFVEEDALVDPVKAEEDWNANNPLIVVRRGALTANKVVERQPAAYPHGMDKLLEQAIGAIPDVTGINMEMMGLVDRDQPGIVESSRKQAALTILATLFSNFNRFIKERGRVVLHFIMKYMNDGRLMRISDDSGKPQYVPLQLPKDAVDYDVITDDAPASINRKQETFLVLRELLPHIIAAQIPMPPDVLDYVPLPQALVQKWKETLQPKGMDPQQQMLLMKKLMQDLQEQAADIAETMAKTEKTKAEIGETKADTILAMAKAKEKGERVQLDTINSMTPQQPRGNQ